MNTISTLSRENVSNTFFEVDYHNFKSDVLACCYWFVSGKLFYVNLGSFYIRVVVSIVA